jgi:hypothetical protein
LKPRQQWRGFFIFRQKKRPPVLVLAIMGSHTGSGLVGRGVSRPRRKVGPHPPKLKTFSFPKKRQQHARAKLPENRLNSTFQ